MRRSVEGTWELEANISFLGWGPCTKDSKGIRVQITDEWEHAKALGNAIDGLKNGVVLSNVTNIERKDWCDDATEFCARAIAIHEFGHALGFAHEQNRADTPKTCDRSQGTNPDTNVGEWDLYSVMNYCSRNNGILSMGDVTGTHQLYDAPQSAAVVSPSSERLEVFRRRSDQAIHQQSRDGTTWQQNVSRGGLMTGTPAAISPGPDRIDLFARGVNGLVWQKHLAAGTWSSWTSMRGPQIFGSPVAVHDGPSRVHVLVRAGDSLVWHTGWNGTVWSPWVSISAGEGAIGSIAAVATSYGRVTAFWRRLDGSIWTAVGAPRPAGFAFAAPQNLGGPVAGNPTATAWGDGQLAVFVRGRDGAIWYRQASIAVDPAGNPLDSWGGWASLGGPIAGDPSAITSGEQVSVFARSLDGALWQADLGSGWVHRGGNLYGNPTAISRGRGLIDVVYRNEVSGLSVISGNGLSWAAPKSVDF